MKFKENHKKQQKIANEKQMCSLTSSLKIEKIAPKINSKTI